MAAPDDPGHEFEEFESFINTTYLDFGSGLQVKDLAARKVIEHSDEYLHMLDTLIGKLRNIVPGGQDMNLLGMKENIRAEADELSKERAIALGKKLEKKAAKSDLEIKLTDLKKEIERLNEENQQIAAELDKPDLPVVLKIMSSKNFY